MKRKSEFLKSECLYCPKCGSDSIGFNFSLFDAFEKRGSKIVRKRNVEFVLADWICCTCKYQWSAPACISGLIFNRRMSREAIELRMHFTKVTAIIGDVPRGWGVKRIRKGVGVRVGEVGG